MKAPQWIAHPGFRGVGKKMHDEVQKYFQDAAPLAALNVQQIFDYVASIPYIDDSEALNADDEFLARPARFKELQGLDCKKKSILIACWAVLNNIPYRFIAVNDTTDSGEDGVSHVFCQILLSGEWISMDATLPNIFSPGAPMPLVRYAEEI